jgi:hypothetical protein
MAIGCVAVVIAVALISWLLGVVYLWLTMGGGIR